MRTPTGNKGHSQIKTIQDYIYKGPNLEGQDVGKYRVIMQAAGTGSSQAVSHQRPGGVILLPQGDHFLPKDGAKLTKPPEVGTRETETLTSSFPSLHLLPKLLIGQSQAKARRHRAFVVLHPSQPAREEVGRSRAENGPAGPHTVYLAYFLTDN